MVVLSDESVISHFMANDEVPANLRAAFGKVKIMLTIREQLSVLSSAYLQHRQNILRREDVAEQAHYSFSEWLEGRKERLVAMYDYHGVVSAFEKEFGRANVGVFLFEDLRRDLAQFTAPICEFIGVDASTGEALMQHPNQNRRVSVRELTYLGIKAKLFRNRSPGRLLPKAVRMLVRRQIKGGASPKIEWRSDQAAEFADLFRHGNRRLQEDYGLDLESAGYPL